LKYPSIPASLFLFHNKITHLKMGYFVMNGDGGN
jgi:hypothetical protein